MKKVFFALIILSLGVSIGWWLPKLGKVDSITTSTIPLNVGPLYYQVQKSVSDEFDQMDRYPTKDRYYGKPARIDFTSAPNAKKFYTLLTAGALQGPNAAGHYTVVQIPVTGDGLYTYIIDARTGKIILDGQLENSRWRYAIESDVVIADGIANPAHFFGPSESEINLRWPINSKSLLLKNGELKEVGDLSWAFGIKDNAQ